MLNLDTETYSFKSKLKCNSVMYYNINLFLFSYLFAYGTLHFLFRGHLNKREDTYTAYYHRQLYSQTTKWQGAFTGAHHLGDNLNTTDGTVSVEEGTQLSLGHVGWQSSNV